MNRVMCIALLLLMLAAAPALAAPTLVVTDDTGNGCYVIVAQESDASAQYWQIKVDKQSGGIYSFKDLTDVGVGGVHTDYEGTDGYTRQCTLLFFDGRGGNVFTRMSALSGLANRLTFTTAGDNSSFTISYTETSQAASFFHNTYANGGTGLAAGELLTTISLMIRPPTLAGTTWDWTMSFQNVSAHAITSKVWASQWACTYLLGSITKTLDSEGSRTDGAWNGTSPVSFMRWTIGSNPTLGLTQGRTFINDYQDGMSGEAVGGAITTGTWAGYAYSKHAAAFSYSGTDVPASGTRTEAGQFMINIVQSNQSPTADAGDDQTVTDADDNGSQAVTLDGAGSYDADGTIANYVWKEGANQIATGSGPQVTLGVGDHTITLMVTDDDGATASDTVLVTVNAPVRGTLVYDAYDNANGTYKYRQLNMRAVDAGSNTIWSMGIWVPQDGYDNTTHQNWSPGEIRSFKDVSYYPSAPYEYSPEVAASTSVGLMRMSSYWPSGTQGIVYRDGTSSTDHSWKTSDYYQFTKSYVLTSNTNVTYLLTVKVNAPVLDGSNYTTTIDGTLTITNNGASAFDLAGTAYTEGVGSLALNEDTFQTQHIVAVTAGTSKPNSHVTIGTDGHELYEIYDWFGSTVTSSLPGLYAKQVVRSNTNTSSRHMRPGMTFELRQDTMNFYYVDVSNTVKGTTTVNATDGVKCSISGQTGVFGPGAQLLAGSSVTRTWVGIISTQATPPPPVLGNSTYYVDYDGGNDTNDGLSTTTAWKHSPGDSAAANVPATTNLWPGDTVNFKGGVVYRGAVNISSSGLADAQITYDGNTAGTFGTGQAIIDGSEPLTGWTQCQSASEAGDNDRWADIWYAYAPAGTSSGPSNLFEGNAFCWLAQDPNQAFPEAMDNIKYFYVIPCTNMTTTSVTDSTNLNQSDPNYWNGASVMLWVQPNAVNYRPILSFDPALDKITYATTGAPYTDRDEKYAIYNSIHLIDQPGEYYFNDTAEGNGTHKVWLWPPSGTNPNNTGVTISVRSKGFNAGAISYVTIQGFKIQKFSGGDTAGAISFEGTSSNPSRNIEIVNNSTYGIRVASGAVGNGTIVCNNLLNSIVSYNTLDLSCSTRGIAISGNYVDTSYNVITRVDGTAIRHTPTNYATVCYNQISNCHGTHGNGITIYGASSTVRSANGLIAYNWIFDANICVTVENCDNITIRHNVCRFSADPTNDFYCFADWGGSTYTKVHNNTFIRSTNTPAIAISGTAVNAESKNNLTSWWSPSGEDGDATRNYHLLQSQLTTLFVDPANGDYHLKTGSPAIDRGLNLGYSLDFDGVSIPQNGTPDIGAYEYQP